MPDKVRQRADTADGLRIEAIGVSRRVRSGRRTLQDVSLTIEPGELVAIVGGSGTGKTTLLDTLAGIRPAAEGTVRYNRPLNFGYVPQDDIIHRELPLARTLGYAARLRLPKGTPADEIDAAVREVLTALDLKDRASLRVGSLSGGQRKRAGIAVELLTRPDVFFLDEPTSGLDPATAADFMRLLRRLADGGTTVVLATHNPPDVRYCDKIAFLARDGYLAYFGTPAGACAYFDTGSIEEIYERLAAAGDPRELSERFQAGRPDGVSPAGPSPRGSSSGGHPPAVARAGPIAQAGHVPAQPRHSHPQPAHSRHSRRLAGHGPADVRGAVPAGRLRRHGPEPECDRDDPVLDRLRRVLLRADVRAVADLRRVRDPAPGAAGRSPPRPLPSGQGDRAAAAAGRRRRTHARRAACP